MKKLLIITLILLTVAASGFCDILYLNQGEEILGNLIESNGQTVKFKDLKNKIHNFKTSQIAHILISKIRKGDEINNVNQITDKLVKNILKNNVTLKQFPDSDYVTLYVKRDFEFTDKGEIKYTRRELIKVLKEPGLEKANRSIYYLKNNEHFELVFAHTYSPNGKVYHITDDAISNETLYSAAPEYAKLKKFKFALKKVDIGSVIDICYVQNLKTSDILHPFALDKTFGQREPVLKDILTVTYPKNLKLKIKELNFKENKNIPQKSKTLNKNKITLTYTFTDKKGYIPEQNMLSSSRIFPRVVIYKPYSLNKIAYLLTDAYKNNLPDKALLQKFLKSAKLKNKTPFEKVSAIYNLINKEIKSINMSPNDMGSFIPVSANVTLKKKYGNKQARLALFYYALKSINIPVNIGFSTGSNHIITAGKNYNNLYFTPSPVLKIIINDKTFYTDGGSLYRPFGSLATYYQGSTAFFINNNTLDFCKLPYQTNEWNRFSKTVFVKLNKDGTMRVKEITRYKGPFEVGIRNLRSVKEKEKRMFAERRIKRIHPNAILNGFALSNIEDLNSPAIFTLDYTIPKAAQKASNKLMTFTNYWVNYNSSSASLVKRKFPMQYWATEVNEQTVIFELPKNYNWVKWNKQYCYDSSKISFNSNMIQKDNLLLYSEKFICRTTEFVTAEEYNNYRNCTLTMGNLANQWIVIEKKENEQKQKNIKIKQNKKPVKIIDMPEPQG